MTQNANTDGAEHRWWRRPSLVPLARVFVVLVCVSLVATDGWLMWKARQVQLRDAEIETSNLASALARQASDTLKKADTVLLDLVERLQVDGTQPEQLQRLQGLMRQHVYEQAELHGLFAYDREGNWLVNSFGEVPPGANNADREYFIYHRQYPDDHGAHVGKPVRSRTTGDWIIPLSRRLEDAQGNFAGVALATISIDFFRQFYATFDIREHGSINLVLNDGTLLVRSPYREDLIGASIAGGQIFKSLLPQSPTGTAILPSVIDGVERLFSYRQIQGYPLVVIAALAEQDILADWREDTSRQLVVVMLLAVMLALFGFYLLRLIKQGQKTEIELMATRDALRTFNKRLEQQALEDELTRLANRRRFIRAISDEFARAARSQKPLALVMFDVDYFKQYNDIYGHSAGDECLRTVAEVIRGGQKRPADLAVRYGGEEFCLLLPETDAQGALQVAEQARVALEELGVAHAGSPWRRLSLSAGVNVCQPSPDMAAEGGPQRLIQGADKALYAAKAAGRDRVVLYDDKVEQLIG
ncbi:MULTISPECIES: sensor domain-containing diguanylate cyclase [unclassified Pseudomonas]|uniref:sensor domain-containing diguanylate cyclase n=1 Tax=unclassified Pseudomonas TaxID=196821 RepID=UPI002447197A|nr:MULTISPECIES: sensor domain-containing diguanylate cyclase [unclassified Pseudomonas]MDG9925746.1 sensor domain-containing diguanylate cyclase [Pseudomonas sp. GD04045]MDH0037426.1 sensor domain-containing diguanylate cyclase [Pseudomonas sp. GD04019]